MSELAFSLNATLPVFVLIVVGALLRRVGFIDEAFARKANGFVFKVALPVLLFNDLATVDLSQVMDLGFVAFCFAATLGGILIAFILSVLLYRTRPFQGEFVQAAYRSSATLLGVAFVQNIYGSSGIAPLMLIGAVPLYNIMAVLILQLMKPERQHVNGTMLKETAKDVVTNPILIGIVVGFAWSALRLPLPQLAETVVSDIGSLATPLGLIAMGALFDLSQARTVGKPAILASLVKTVGLVAVFLPVAVALGFRQQELVAVLVMLGSGTTFSAYVMACTMGHNGALSSCVVALSTLFSAFTLTAWLTLLRALALI